MPFKPGVYVVIDTKKLGSGIMPPDCLDLIRLGEDHIESLEAGEISDPRIFIPVADMKELIKDE